MRTSGDRLLAMGLVALGLAAAGCALGGIDSAAKADLDQRLAALQTSEETYPPSELFSPMAFVVGQWTQHRVLNEKNEPSLVTSKIVGQDEGAYWLEIVDESYHGRQVVKLLVAMLAGRDPTGMEIRAARTRTGHEAPVVLEGAALEEARKRYRGDLDLLAIAFESDVKDDAKVPAGRFIGCYAAKTEEPWGPLQVPSVVCSHPSVPLSGIVRAKPVGRAGLMELVGFGTTGAESEL